MANPSSASSTRECSSHVRASSLRPRALISASRSLIAAASAEPGTPAAIDPTSRSTSARNRPRSKASRAESSTSPRVHQGQQFFDDPRSKQAALLNCHDRYEHRKDKRAQLEQARDAWYDIVRAKYSPANVNSVEEVARKTDLDQITSEIKKLGELVLANIKNGTLTTQDAANVASTMSSIVAPPSHRYTGQMPVDAVMAPPLTLRNLMSSGDDPKDTKR
jgi:hypothetical protein